MDPKFKTIKKIMCLPLINYSTILAARKTAIFCNICATLLGVELIRLLNLSWCKSCTNFKLKPLN